MAKYKNCNHILFNIIRCIIFLGFNAYAVPYEYSYTLDCLETPLRPQYNGGIVVNPELNEELKGWTTFGDAKIEHATSVSAWLQVSSGKADMAAIFKTGTSYETSGWVTAQEGCWSMLKGGLVVKESGPTNLYFETNNTEIDIWADSFSLQSFSHQEWESHQRLRVQKVRKTKVRFDVVDKHNRPIRNVTVSINQTRHGIPFGCSINSRILTNEKYQKWFLARFHYTAFENELKWYSTEPTQGVENYATADAMVRFARKHRVTIRGHNILSDDPFAQPSWVRGLSSTALLNAAIKRINSVTNRYKADFIQWDVVNENIHRSYFEDRLGNPNVSTLFYKKASKIDPHATPFLNEYNTIEMYEKGDLASPARYIQRIRNMTAQGYVGPLGIGLQGHFGTSLNLPGLRAALDILAKMRLPIWITELDVRNGAHQATDLKSVVNELYATKAVGGIVIWSARDPQQRCFRMCLTDENFENLATGDVVDKFKNQSLRHKNADDLSDKSTDSNCFYEASLYHGDYQVLARHPNNQYFSSVRLSVLPTRLGRVQVHRLTIDDEIHE